MSGRYEQVQAGTRAQWRDWLAPNHATSPGIWLVTWKKTSGRPYPPYDGTAKYPTGIVGRR